MLLPMMKFGARLISPAGSRLSILIYHRVLPQPDPLSPGSVTAQEFEGQMAMLAGSFNVLPLSDAVRRLKDGTLPERAAAITFDDGYADNYLVALPILSRWHLPATFFVATGFLDGGRMWNDSVIESVRRAGGPHLDLSNLHLGVHAVATPAEKIRTIASLISQLKYLPPQERAEKVAGVVAKAGLEERSDLMMSSEQVRLMGDAGMEVGAHTVNHPILETLSDQEAETEISAGKSRLEEITGRPVSLFAYPNGKPGTDYSPRDVSLVRRLGFAAAVSTHWGAATRSSDVFQLPRFTPWDRDPVRYYLRMLHNCRRPENLPA